MHPGSGARPLPAFRTFGLLVWSGIDIMGLGVLPAFAGSTFNPGVRALLGSVLLLWNAMPGGPVGLLAIRISFLHLFRQMRLMQLQHGVCVLAPSAIRLRT
jgi:hypothetical protein